MSDTEVLPTVLSVSALARLARETLEQQLPLLWIAGEISNLTIAASGHYYFSLKDDKAQIRTVLFRAKALRLEFRPSNGMQVEALAAPTLYEARGEFQLQAETLRPAGLGRLFAAFQKLKAKLEQEGLFASERKRPLPPHPRAIGIVTSTAAAALRDVLSTLARRMPNTPLIIYPTPVQGEGAADKIAAALTIANARSEVDVILLCRGGGSIEDLWAFNEECVARAIAASRIPVISGVGHETDFTIADFVADLRAPTPTAAAEHAGPDAQVLRQQVQALEQRFRRSMERRLRQDEQTVDYLARRLIHPAARLEQQAKQLQTLQLRLSQAMQSRLGRSLDRQQMLRLRLLRRQPALDRHEARLQQLRSRLHHGLQSQLQYGEQTLGALSGALAALNPLAVLQRGYVLVELRGRPLTRARDAHVGQQLRLVWHDGHAEARIEAVQTGLLDVEQG